jgi:hypothetical protein
VPGRISDLFRRAHHLHDESRYVTGLEFTIDAGDTIR